jgi:hypothetical protein
MMGKFREILAGVPRTSKQAAEIVPHPSANLDAQARRIRELEGQLVDATAELSRVGLRYNTIRSDLIRAREQLCEALKESGIKVEFVRVPPELELD